MIKIASNKECRILAELASHMWDDAAVDELAEDFLETIHSDQAACFIYHISNLCAGSKKKKCNRYERW